MFGLPEVHSAGTDGHAAQAGTVPVDLPRGQNQARLRVFTSGLQDDLKYALPVLNSVASLHFRTPGRSEICTSGIEPVLRVFTSGLQDDLK